MSRIQFTSSIEEIVGKLAGSVFQDSYFGMQIRTRVSPRNPQSYYQQLRRGEFGYLSAGWRSLSVPDQDTWVIAAGSIAAGFRLYVSCNVNLSLIGITPINAYPGTTSPALFPVDIYTSSLLVLEIIAVTSLNVVPANHSLLIFTTYEKAPTKVFTNPAQYSPVVTLAAGSSLAASVDILPEWVARFGQPRTDKRICLKSVLINTTNGIRGPEFFSCAINPFITQNQIIDSFGNTLVNSDGSIITYP